MKRYIPDNADRPWLDQVIAGKEPEDNNKTMVMWWVTLSPDMKKRIKAERYAEKKSEQVSNKFTSFLTLLAMILVIYIGNQTTANTLLILLFAILGGIIMIIVTAIGEWWVQKRKFNKELQKQLEKMKLIDEKSES